MWQLAVLFVAASAFGFVLENHVLGFRNKRDRVLQSLGVSDRFNVFLTMYGFGALVLYGINVALREECLLLRILVCAVALVAFECVVGLLSKAYFGTRSWDYRDERVNCCNGFVGGRMTLLLLGISIAFCVLFDLIQ